MLIFFNCLFIFSYLEKWTEVFKLLISCIFFSLADNNNWKCFANTLNIVIYDKWSIELGNHLLDSPYYKKIDRSIFPDFPGHTDLDGKCFIDVMSKDNNNEKSVLNKIDQHPNEFGNKLIAEYVKGLL